MRHATNNTLPPILIQPLKIRPIRIWLLVKEPGNRRKRLPLTEQRPPINIIPVDLHILLEERPSSRDIDPQIPVGNAEPRLVVPLVEGGGVDDPGGVVPGYVLEASLIDTGGIGGGGGGAGI